jgi:hypothetical protein
LVVVFVIVESLPLKNGTQSDAYTNYLTPSPKRPDDPAMLHRYPFGGPARDTIEAPHTLCAAVPIGAIFRLRAPRAKRPRTYIVEAWLTRTRATSQRSRPFVHVAGGVHLAMVRDLGNGRHAMLPDRIIRQACLASDPRRTNWVADAPRPTPRIDITL